jgi:hypothetical protein
MAKTTFLKRCFIDKSVESLQINSNYRILEIGSEERFRYFSNSTTANIDQM